MSPPVKGDNWVHIYRDIYVKDKIVYSIRAKDSGIYFLSNNILVKDAVFSVRNNKTKTLRNIHAFVKGLLVFDLEEAEKIMPIIRLSKEYGYYDQRKQKHFYNQCGKKLISARYVYITSNSNGGSYMIILDPVHGHTTDFSMMGQQK